MAKSFSQIAEKKDKIPSVKLLHRSQKEKILLRWAVDEPLAWKKTNTSGYILEKYLIFKDGVRLTSPQKLWTKTFKAEPIEQWQQIVESNDYAAIIAQALYGQSFQVDGTQGELATIVNLSKEIEQRFSFALFAADMNFEAACKAGWGYTDIEVKPNEKYAYKIKSAYPKEKLDIKGTTVLASTKDAEPLPSPMDLHGIYGDKRVVITWEYQLFKKIYTSYNLERSEDGVTFKRLNSEPMVNLNDKPDAPAKRMIYVDSLATNNKNFYYRVQGISPFGELGQYSDTISGQGKPILPFTPRIHDFKFTENDNEASIFWEFPKKGEKLIEKFQLLIADKDAGPYEIAIDDIAPSRRELKFSDLYPSSYLKIKAIGTTEGQEKTSFSTLIQPKDHTPPAIPTELIGEIDSLGIVKINWKLNTEKDFLGYRIFRGFTEKEEPSQLTETPFPENQFIDTVKVKNLNAKVYYQVVAVDKRYNHSKKSEVLVIEKPDVIPPTSPVFSDYRILNSSIVLYWKNSTENEAKHVLYRKNKSNDGDWEEIFITMDGTNKFVDKSVAHNNSYQYKINAIDNNGLISEDSSPLTIKATSLQPQKEIKSVNYEINRQENYIALSWKTDERNIIEYTIYKQVNEETPSTWRIVPSKVKQLKDEAIHPNQTYIYHFRGTLNNGKFTQVKKVEVKY